MPRRPKEKDKGYIEYSGKRPYKKRRHMPKESFQCDICGDTKIVGMSLKRPCPLCSKTK